MIFSIIIMEFGYSQTDNILDKLDFKYSSMKDVYQSYQKGDFQKALSLLLKRYTENKNLYLNITQKEVAFIKKNYPEDVSKTIKTADDVLKHRFLFRNDWDMEKTNIPYQFEEAIDWKAVPNDDEEWCFMLNRHKFWVDLGRAYFITGDEKYAKEFVDQVLDWIDNNPNTDNLKNVSWRRIEAGIRCENWIKSFEYIKKSKYITPEFFEAFLNALYQHGTYLNSTFSNFSKTSNWGVLEFHGLYNLSLFLKGFIVAPSWKESAIDKLSTCIDLQVLEDGSQWEQSPMYHNEVFHCFMNVNLLAHRFGIRLPENIIEKTKKMAYANVKWQKPNFHQPLLGDSDDTDLRGLLTLASSIFKDPTLKSRGYDEFDYESIFTMGLECNEDYKKEVSKMPDFLSVYQQSSGDFYMRSSWEQDATYTGLHLKKLGCGHGHDNLLHFTIYANGKDYLVDGGRYTYVNNKWREFFKNSKSHNTLGVDNLTNSVYKDSWTNDFEARSNGLLTMSTSSFDYAEAENSAYMRLKDPVLMKRRMLYLKPNIWLIFDSFLTNGTHTYSQYFNFSNDSVQIRDNGVSTTFKNSNLRIQPINEVEIKLENSYWSPEYNLMKANKRAVLFQNNTGFTSFISLLYFPSKTKLSYKKTPVYDRNDVLVSNTDAEALNLFIGDKMYTLLVVHNSPSPASHFFRVNDVFLHGEVVLVEKNKSKSKIYIIKE